MPLLHNGEWVAASRWARLNDDEAFPSDDSHVIISLERFLSLDGEHRNGTSGVSLAPTDDPHALVPYLDHLPLVCIEIPVFTDGRGYSHARVLRNRLGYRREIRAVGDVRPDQLLFMMRVGIDAFDFPTMPDKALVRQILSRYQNNYQPSYPLPAATSQYQLMEH